MLVFAGTVNVLIAAQYSPVRGGLRFSIFIDELFHTGNDADNRAAVRQVPWEKQALAGLAVHDPRNAVGKIRKGASLHR